jgi:hypothetical protein
MSKFLFLKKSKSWVWNHSNFPFWIHPNSSQKFKICFIVICSFSWVSIFDALLFILFPQQDKSFRCFGLVLHPIRQPSQPLATHAHWHSFPLCLQYVKVESTKCATRTGPFGIIIPVRPCQGSSPTWVHRSTARHRCLKPVSHHRRRVPLLCTSRSRSACAAPSSPLHETMLRSCRLPFSNRGIEAAPTLRYPCCSVILFWTKGSFCKILASNLMRYCICSPYCCYTCDFNILGTHIEASVSSFRNQGMTIRCAGGAKSPFKAGRRGGIGGGGVPTRCQVAAPGRQRLGSDGHK